MEAITSPAPPPIPVIDLSPLAAPQPDAAAVRQLASALHAACRDVGFLYIAGHGLSQGQLDGLTALATRLFDLPQVDKEALDAARSPLARGYNSLQHGRHSCTPEDGGPRDAKESFTVGMERQAGDPRPPSPMHGPNQWPPEAVLPGWRVEAEAAVEQLLAAARLLMRGLALALQAPPDYFTSRCTDPVAQMVLFRYPPTGGTEEQRGCGAHTDCGFLTLVAQDAPGIEVQLSDGSWHAAPALPGCLLVNLGDMAARWAGDTYKSTVHRVHNRSDAATRHSLVFFCNTDFDAVVETMPSCLPPGVGAAAAEGGGGGSEAAAAVAGGTGSEAAAAGTDGGGSVAAAAGGGVIGRRHPPIKAGDYILQKLGLMFN
ncbi:oxidoreductase [Micractinium conductrix]|uniref:Oxidoreductase n=1 Tax=Micractinium conductrix TaxID=554055 RepID=A0A2P6V5C8_9CHLO|nr:oxidoreductase [Micractinium conductrix]|eukprot:PSC69301.1 oxidoreductase [Micractinium conductrix]